MTEPPAESTATPSSTPVPTPLSVSDDSRQPTPSSEAATTPMTQLQADQILAELKSIKQRLFWVLLIGGFFVARALFFHY